MRDTWWSAVIFGLALVATVIAFFFGDDLRDALDPSGRTRS